MRAVTLTCVLLLAGCLATAQTYPNCDWKCTSNDVVVTEIVMSGPDLCSSGDPVSGQLLLTLYNRTGTDRYAVRVLADLYVDGLYETSFDDCVAESVPPGTTTLVLAVVDWTCGESLEFRDLIVSWTTKEESCGDTPNCTDRKTKCSFAPVVPVAGTPLAAGFSFDEPICDGDLVAFADATSGGEPPYVYSWDFGDSVGTDTSDDPSYLYDAPGVYTVTLVVTDAAGLNGSATSEVVVSAAPDAEASNGGPYCAGDTIELFAGGGVGYRWSGPDGFTSDDEDPTIASASAAHAGTYTVTVTSASGCSAEASTRVELDTAAPLLTVPSDAEVECGGSTDPAQTGEAAATDDRDLSPTVTFSDVATLGACGGFSGTIERTWTATDACGNSVSAVQTITVVDTTDPVLSVPADVTVECDADSSSASTGVATATDNCDPAPAVTESDSVAAGTCLQESVITRTWTATDACGNVASEIQTITIVDTTPPSLSVSGAQFECDGAGNVGNISTWLASAVGADGCSDVTVTENYAGLIGSCPGTGAAEVTFVAIDACGNNAERTATVTVIDTTAPSAEDDAASTDEDAAVTIDVLANDSDACSDSVAFESVGAPTFGTAEIEGREIRYVPPIDFHGTVSFSYTVVDCSGNPDTATVEITVLSVNDPPEANDQAATAREDTPLGMTVTATDPDGDPITYRIVSGPSHGTITGFDADSGELIYTPADDYHGADAFTFEACDPSGACDTATVTITVEAVDDPPSADPQRLTTPEDTPVGITVTGSDADGDPITYRIVSGPSHGTIVGFDAETGGLTYEPERNYTGTDGFVFEACDPDPGQGCAQATVTIVVEPENDPPVASDQTRVTPEDTATGYFSLSIGDPDDGLAELACDCLTPPQHGTVERGANHTVNYTPDADYFGEDGFTYIVCDPDGACDTATVLVTVLPANDPPDIGVSGYVTPEDTPVGVGATATDPDGDTLTFTILSSPNHGEIVDFDPARGTGIYVPGAGYSGSDSLFVSVCDSEGGCDVGTITILVVPENDAPTAVCFDTTVTQGVAVDLTLRATDPEGDPISFEIVVPPRHGRIAGFEPLTGALVVVPDTDYVGPDEIVFRACDDSLACDTCVVQLLVVRVSGAGGAAGPCEERIAISEVGWPGTRAGETHEWIELRNLEPTAVNLTGWTLRWRSALSAEGRGGVWRSIRLAGVIGAAEPDAPLVFLRNGAQSQTWWVSWASVPRDDFFLLERGSDDILPLVPADLVYGEETVGLATLDLEDVGAVLELIDPSGCRVDTANVFAPVLGGWAAGSVAPPASMERIDPYGPDVTGNWHTNLGLVRNGLDGMGNLIHGTPRGSNSPILADLVERERLEPATIRSGDPLSIRIETRPEWPLERGLWHVAVLDGRSSEPLAADWAIEGGTEGEAVVRVAIGRWAEGIVHVWIRTPAGALLVALFDVVP